MVALHFNAISAHAATGGEFGAKLLRKSGQVGGMGIEAPHDRHPFAVSLLAANARFLILGAADRAFRIARAAALPGGQAALLTDHGALKRSAVE